MLTVLLSSLLLVVYLATSNAGTIGLILSVLLIVIGAFELRKWPGFVITLLSCSAERVVSTPLYSTLLVR